MYDILLDPRVGIISRLEPAAIPAQFPESFTLTHAVLSDTRRFSPWPSDSTGAGYAFNAPEQARAAAIGEAAERYCGNLIPPDLSAATFQDLQAAGVLAIDPESICLYSEGQYQTSGFPAVPLTRADRLEWTPGLDLATGETILTPACLVYVSYFSAPRPRLTNPIIQAGLAAGPTAQFARWSALREVIERDAMAMSWTGGLGFRALHIPTWLAHFARGPQGALCTRFFALHQEFGIPVIAALVRDDVTGYLSMGIGVHHDGPDAAVKAFAEALQLQLFVAAYDDPAGGYARAAALPGSPLKPWRADRAYGQSYRADCRDVVDYGCHLQLHLDPQVQATFDTELEQLTIDTVALEDLHTAAPPADPLAAMVDRLTGSGYQVVTCDLTTPDIAAAGLHVSRVVVPGLLSNSPLGLPFLGGHRLPTPPGDGSTRPSAPLPH